MTTTDDERCGTVIQGTLRLQDLIPAFAAELRARSIAIEHPAERFPHYVDLVDRASKPMNLEQASDLLTELGDALDELAPEGTYFGTHVGDGADFGYWPVEDDR